MKRKKYVKHSNAFCKITARHLVIIVLRIIIYRISYVNKNALLPKIINNTIIIVQHVIHL